MFLCFRIPNWAMLKAQPNPNLRIDIVLSGPFVPITLIVSALLHYLRPTGNDVQENTGSGQSLVLTVQALLFLSPLRLIRMIALIVISRELKIVTGAATDQASMRTKTFLFASSRSARRSVVPRVTFNSPTCVRKEL